MESYLTHHCPHCDGGIEFPREGLGQTISCPHCNKSVTLTKDSSSWRLVMLVVLVFVFFGIVATIFFVRGRDNRATSTKITTEKKVPSAFDELVAKAERGDANAQDNLGLFYLQGEGVQKDEAKAIEWFSKAAAQNLATAQNHLGYCYAEARGTSRNYQEAMKWWLEAAKQNNADAQFNLGQSYALGEAGEKNWREAIRWYRAASEQGYARAQFNLGICYDNDNGLPENKTEAVRWYQRSARQGDALSQYVLGTKYQFGEGVTQDSIEALKWYGISLANGLNKAEMNGFSTGDLAREANKNVSLLENQMTTSQVEEARRRAQAFVPQKPSPIAPTESLEPIAFSDLTHKFEIRIERILIGQRTVDENVFHQFQLDDFHARNKEVVYFEISLKNIDGQQEHELSFFDFSLQDKAGNTYSCEQTTDYIHGKVLRGKTGHGGIAFAVENGNVPTTLTYDTGYIDSAAYVVNSAQVKLFAKAYALDRLKIFKQPLGSD